MTTATAQSPQGGVSIAEQSLAAQAALLPQALAVFGICLPIFVWAGSFAQNATWMSASFAIFAINWGAFYFALQWLRRPEMQNVGRRTRVHVMCGLLWSVAVWQMAAFADHAGPARDTLLLMDVGAAVICLFFTTPSLPSLLIAGPTAMAGPLVALMSANVYFGAWPIVEALKKGAQVIITGRTTDTGLTLAPMIHEFGWREDEWDRIAAGTIAGHILECGGQASGGNFSADWRSVPDLAHIGFPIAEAHPDGDIIITKHENTGGLVSVQTVKEQLMYEIGNPANYITPDCVANFTTIQLEEVGRNRVRMSGVKGRPATDSYKVSMSYLDGYTAFGTLTYAWPDALEKAKAADRILRTRLVDLGLRFDEVRSEFLGYNSCLGPLSAAPDEMNEVVLRVGVRSHDHHAVESFGKELAPLILTGPPGVTGFAGGRPKPSEVIAYWPALIPKSAVTPHVLVEEI